jgi:hypothetical protein
LTEFNLELPAHFDAAFDYCLFSSLWFNDQLFVGLSGSDDCIDSTGE